MAWRFIALAWSARTPDAKTKLVLLRLADAANDDGECWPSHATVAADTNLSTRSVRRAVDQLADAGFITVEPRTRADGSQTTSMVRLSPPLDTQSPPLDTVATPPGHTVHPPEPIREPIREPKNKNPLWSPKGEESNEQKNTKPRPTTRRKSRPETGWPAGWVFGEVEAAAAKRCGAPSLDAARQAFSDFAAWAQGNEITSASWALRWSTWCQRARDRFGWPRVERASEVDQTRLKLIELRQRKAEADAERAARVAR